VATPAAGARIVARSPEAPVKPGRRWIAGAYLALAVAIPAVGLAALLSANDAGKVASFDDDAYYYFRVAHNIVAGAGSTFDGFGRTNGYHPLWLLLLLPIFRFVARPLDVLPAVYLLSAMFWAAAFGTVFLIGRQVQRPMALVVATLPLAVFGSRFSGPGGIYLGGMEVVVTLLCVVLLLWMCLRNGYLSPVIPPRNRALVVGGVLSVMFLSRLDSVFFIAAFLVVAVLRWHGSARERFGALARTVAPLAVVVIGYAGFNRWYFGTATPISGQAKSLGAPNVNTQPLTVLLRFGVVFGRPVYVGGLTMLATLASLMLWWRRRQSHRAAEPTDTDTDTDTVGFFLLAGTMGLVALFAYLVFFTTYQAWSWYFYLLPINLMLACFLLLDLGFRGRLDRAGHGVAAVLALAAMAVPVGTGALQFRQLRHETVQSSWVDQAVAAADWINSQTPPGSVLAMGDSAGAVGYLARRPLVQLEGLVESPDYVDSLAAGRATSFLRSKGVSYLIMTRPATDLPTGSGCQRYLEPVQGRGPKMSLMLCADDAVYDQQLDDGRRYVVWRYHSDLNPAQP
jgi:hypothetical protein